MVAVIIQLAMLDLYDVIQELPHILVSPINDGVDDYLVLSADAAYFCIALLCELVSVGVLSALLRYLIHAPLLKVALAVGAELMA